MGEMICPKCDGIGAVTTEVYDGWEWISEDATTQEIFMDEMTCPECDGFGSIETPEEFEDRGVV